ncbi:PE-PPE domain protein [Mycobacteroides salmoniphilum]|nr:PE-PPE domain protein [Mycobacteroides salmoniphilum]
MSGRHSRSSKDVPNRSRKRFPGVTSLGSVSVIAEAPVRLPLPTSRAMLATTALVTATALAVSVAAPTTVNLPRPDFQAAATLAPRAMNLDIQLASMVGMYGVGPVFQALRLAGVGSPDAVLTNAVGLLNNPHLSSAVKTLLDVLNTVSPLEAKVPGFGPAGVYDSVNELGYSLGAFSGLEGVVDTINSPWINWIPGIGAISNNLLTLLNQRRAFILGDGLGGTDTALALRQMITDVESDSALWGNDKHGVTGVVAVLFRNTSRPGGGLMAMVTPISELFGLNLSNPDAGSYTNAGANAGLATKVLNISVTDVGWKYDLLSDAPSTLNPLAWANSVAGVVMPTYLIPDKDKAVPVVANLVGQLLPGLINAGLVTTDPTGGQGLHLLTQGTILDAVNGPLNSALNAVLGPVFQSILGAEFKFPVEGTSTYVTYDSGNLPLLEPFHMLPRLLGYAGLADITTPVADSFESALTQLVALGYQDVKGTTDANGVMTFTRGMDMAAVQADVFRAPTNINWAQRFEVPQTVFNALIDGFSNNLLSPEKQKLTLFGNSALGDAIYKNALVVSVAHAVRDGLTQLKGIANPMFNQVQTMLKPVADALDVATVQVNKVIDQGRAAVKGLNIDVSKPLFDANRAINESTKSLDNGVLGAVQSAGAHALAARSPAALIALPETLPEPKQLTAGTPDLSSHLLGISGPSKEKQAVVVNADPAPALEKISSAPLSAAKPSVVPDSEPSAQPAAEPAKGTTKEDLKAAPKDDAKDNGRPIKSVVKEGPQDKVDQAAPSLKKQVTDTQNIGSVAVPTMANTDESAASTKTDGAKSAIAADRSKDPKSKQDNDSGQHRDDAKGKDKPAKPVVKEKLQDKVDKANQSLAGSAKGGIKQTRGAITSTVTNTDESATSTKTDGAKSAAGADEAGSSKGTKTKQDNDSGKHHDDGSTGNSSKVKVKVTAPSDSGGKHRAPDGGSAGSNAGGGSDGSGSHSASGSSGGKHSAGD